MCPSCHVVSDHFGYHQVGCGGNCDRILRHNSLRDSVFQQLSQLPWRPEGKSSL